MLVDPQEGTAPTPAALEADTAIRAIPDDYTDCGDTNLSSGWPTTTAFFPEVDAECIMAATDSGEPSQHSFFGRDNQGGINGTILRVNGPGGDITRIATTSWPTAQ